MTALKKRVALSVAIVLPIVGICYWFFGIEFDKERWNAPDAIKHGVRLRMADRMIALGKLDGLHRKAVEELLGVPPKVVYFSDWDSVYRLGRERNWIASIDSEWLGISYNENGYVEKVEILRD